LGLLKKRRERTPWKGKQGLGVGVIYKTWKEETQTEAGGEYMRGLEGNRGNQEERFDYVSFWDSIPNISWNILAIHRPTTDLYS
jgi:hypothetical protein